MTVLPLWYSVTPLARLEAEIHHDILHGIVKGLEGKTVGVFQLILLAELLPGSSKVSLHDPLDVVGHGDVEVLQLVLVIIALVTVRLPCGGITVLHSELQGCRHAGDALREVLRYGEDAVEGAGDVVLHHRSRYLPHHLPALRYLQVHPDILQELVRQSVGAVELQDDVAGEDVLDGRHRVLRLGLGQLHRLAGPEEVAELELLQLRHGGQLLNEHVVPGGGLLGLRNAAGQAHRGPDGKFLLLHGGGGNRFDIKGAGAGGLVQGVGVQRLLQAGHRHSQVVQDVLAVQAGLVLLQDRLEVSRPVPHLVIGVHLTPGEQHQHVGQQVIAQRPELGHGGDSSGPDSSVLQEDSVVDETDVASGVGGPGTFLAQQVQDLHRQDGVLAVLYELAQVGQSVLLRLGVLLDHGDDGVGNAGLVVQAALVSQHARQEVEKDPVLLGELLAETADGLNHHDLELVRDLRDEGGNLLHQPVHAALGSGLEEGGDGQGGDGPVAVRDEVLQVQVAGCHCGRVGHGHLVEGSHGSKPQGWFRRGAEQLEDRHSWGQLFRGCLLHVDDGVSRLVDHHLRLVSQTRLDKVKIGRAGVRVLLLDHLAGDPDEKDDCVGTLEAHPGELGEQLGDGQSVRLPDVVEKTQSVVLDHHVVGADGLLHLIDPPAIQTVPQLWLQN